MNKETGQVFDLSYKHYEGPREGRIRAIKSLWVNGFRSSLGLGRGSKSKILPSLLFFAAIAPAAASGLFASLGASEFAESEMPSHSDYYSFVLIVLLVFSAIIVPDLLIPDRRTGVISLYLVRPLTTIDYISAKWSSFLTIAMILAYSGQLLLTVGYLLAAKDPASYFSNNWLDIPRFIAAGLVVAVFTTTIPMAISCMTSRRAYAAAFTIGIFILAGPISGALTECQDPDEQNAEVTSDMKPTTDDQDECEPVTGKYGKWFALLNLVQTPIHINNMILKEQTPDDNMSKLVNQHNNLIPIAWYLIMVIGAGSVILAKYHRLKI